MKVLLIIGGVLFGAFGGAQVLQLMGVFGTGKFTIAGVGLAFLGAALSLACFKSAFKTPQPQRPPRR